MSFSARARDGDFIFDRIVNWRAMPASLIVRPELSTEPNLFSASEVAQALGRTAAGVVRRMQIDAIVMVGGDTAFETFHALGVADASVAGEIMPGIPKGKMQVDGRSVTFITKAGGFGDADTLVEIFRHLKDQ